jgi:predicted house-cleaning noncanonical NTP pyrophosphatase (MazG superfamily)
MKLLKKIAVAVVITASMTAVSSTAFAAEAHKDLNAIVQAAAKSTEASLLEAKALLEKGGDTNEQIQTALNNARQSVKEFRYEQTERLRQKLNDKLRTAREAFLENKNEEALADVNAALAIYAEMKKVYDAAH